MVTLTKFRLKKYICTGSKYPIIVVCMYINKNTEAERCCRSVPDFDSEPTLIALDCEMCCTTQGSRELLSVSVVDSNGTALLETLVQPAGDILDLRTGITGITAADLKVLISDFVFKIKSHPEKIQKDFDR